MPHNLYLHSSIVQTRHFANDERSRQQAIRLSTADTILSLDAIEGMGDIAMANGMLAVGGRVTLAQFEAVVRDLVPALAPGTGDLAASLGYALLKAFVVLGLILVIGQRLMRGWFHLVAAQKSEELFALNVLFITLGLAYITEVAGLSLALGAFIAGALISETEFRYQVETDIKPFRNVLLGLFFVTIGASL